MKEVFISYSTVDLANAETVRNVLEKNGLSCWMAPRDIPGGSNYTKEIPIAIRNCKVFVLILSKNAQGSQWVLKELDSAVNCGKVILPFMLEDCILNDEFNFLLTGAQRYAAYQKKAEAMETLISRIRGILDVPAGEKAKPTVAVPEEAVPVKKAQKTQADIAGVPECPACSSINVTHLPKKTNRSSFFEKLTMLIGVVFAIVSFVISLIIFGLYLPYDLFELSPLFSLVVAVLCAIWGDRISKTIVKRRRIRKHLPNKCYRCNECQKVFLSDK